MTMHESGVPHALLETPTLRPITASIMRNEDPVAFCVMAAFRTQADARLALALINGGEVDPFPEMPQQVPEGTPYTITSAEAARLSTVLADLHADRLISEKDWSTLQTLAKQAVEARHD